MDYSPALPPPGTVVAFDTEGSGLHADDGARVSVVSLAWREPTGDVRALAVPLGQAGAPDSRESLRATWEAILAGAATWRLVMHHAAHDCGVVNAGTVDTGGSMPGVDLSRSLYWDTMLAERALAPLEMIGLEHACIRRIGAAPWKYHIDDAIPRETQAVVYKRLREDAKWGAKGMAAEAREEAKRIVAARNAQRSRYDRLPWSLIEPYATDDARNTLLLQEQQAIDLLELEEGEQQAYQRKLALCRILIRMELAGVGFDKAEAEISCRILEQLHAEAEAALDIEGPLTPTRLRRYYYDELGYLPTKYDPKTDKYVKSLDDYSRKGLADQGAPQITELNEWIELGTALKMWYRPWPEVCGADGRLRMRVRQAKVSSGRFSGERVNLLAIPHDTPRPDLVTPIRKLIVPKAGHRLVEIDLSQAEPRVGSMAAGCKPLLAEYALGNDMYAKVAAELFGVEPDNERFNYWRQLCKRLVLSSLYAVGANTFVFQVKKFMDIDMTIEEAQNFLAIFREQYPEFKRAERYWSRFVEQHGYVPLALGARRYFTVYEQYYKGFNQRVQGSVAVGLEESMLRVEEAHPGSMLLQVYDSLLLELPTDDDATAPAVGAVVEDTFAEIFHMPFVADIKEWAA